MQLKLSEDIAPPHSTNKQTRLYLQNHENNSPNQLNPPKNIQQPIKTKEANKDYKKKTLIKKIKKINQVDMKKKI